MEKARRLPLGVVEKALTFWTDAAAAFCLCLLLAHI